MVFLAPLGFQGLANDRCVTISKFCVCLFVCRAPTRGPPSPEHSVARGPETVSIWISRCWRRTKTSSASLQFGSIYKQRPKKWPNDNLPVSFLTSDLKTLPPLFTPLWVCRSLTCFPSVSIISFHIALNGTSFPDGIVPLLVLVSQSASYNPMSLLFRLNMLRLFVAIVEPIHWKSFFYLHSASRLWVIKGLIETLKWVSGRIIFVGEKMIPAVSLSNWGNVGKLCT